MISLFAYKMPKPDDFMWNAADVISVAAGAFIAGVIIAAFSSWFATSRHYQKSAVARGLAEFYIDADGDICWRWRDRLNDV